MRTGVTLRQRDVPVPSTRARIGTWLDDGNMSSPSTPRTWIVQLVAKAGFRFGEYEQLTIVAAADSTSPVHGIRLRDHRVWASDDHGEGAPTFVSGLVIEAAGDFASKEEAVAVLANLASPYFQVLALIANAAVEEPEDLVAYAPPLDASDVGEFIIQRHSQMRSPAARLRRLAAADVFRAVQKLLGHPREERLYRAMAHFRMALNHLDPRNRVLSAESLWLVVENMQRVVFDRLCHESGIESEAHDAKHQLALAMGFKPKKSDQGRSAAVEALIDAGELDPKSFKRDNSHLDILDAYIRREVLLEGDTACYKQLRQMSDGFEHGYMTFGDVQKKSAVADAAFTHLRRAILREIGLSDGALFEKRFESPQGVWRPVFEGHGEYGDSACRTIDLNPETLNDPWPDPPGLSLVPLMRGIVDNEDGTRTMTLEVNGTTTAMPTSQTARLTRSTWISPSGDDGQVMSQEATLRLNGMVVESAVTFPQEPPSSQPCA